MGWEQNGKKIKRERFAEDGGGIKVPEGGQNEEQTEDKKRRSVK
jgi:hypothetical protein